MNSSTRITKQLTTLIEVWTALRPTKSFAGMTLEQFKAAVAPSLDARARLTAAKQQASEAMVERDNADQQTAVLVDRLIAAFVAEEEDGYNGVLYAKLGYVRKADRSSGLTRRSTAPAVTEVTLKAA
jgi:DICT domain-containing protein